MVCERKFKFLSDQTVFLQWTTHQTSDCFKKFTFFRTLSKCRLTADSEVQNLNTRQVVNPSLDKRWACVFATYRSGSSLDSIPCMWTLKVIEWPGWLASTTIAFGCPPKAQGNCICIPWNSLTNLPEIRFWSKDFTDSFSKKLPAYFCLHVLPGAFASERRQL